MPPPPHLRTPSARVSQRPDAGGVNFMEDPLFASMAEEWKTRVEMGEDPNSPDMQAFAREMMARQQEISRDSRSWADRNIDAGFIRTAAALGIGGIVGGAALAGAGGAGGAGGASAAGTYTNTAAGFAPGAATTSGAGAGAAAGGGAAAGAASTASRALPYVLAAGSGLNSIVEGRRRDRDRESQEQLTRESLEQRERESLRDTATTEAGRDPFRQQVEQGRAAAVLDFMARSRRTPNRVQLPDRYAQYEMDLSGGLSYEPDDQMRADAGQLRDSVRRGETAPTMTTPANHGRSAALDLTSPAANPLPMPGPGMGPVSYDDLETMAPRRRRTRGTAALTAGLARAR